MFSRKEKHNGYCCVTDINCAGIFKKIFGICCGLRYALAEIKIILKNENDFPKIGPSQQAKQKRFMETAPRERHEPSRERQVLFPTCQLKAVRFYVSSVLLLLFLLLLLVFLVPNCDDVCSVFLAGPQPRSCEFSVPCRTSTAIM